MYRLTALVMLAVAVLLAQATDPPKRPDPPGEALTLTEPEQFFLRELYAAGLREIAISELAEKQTEDPEVRSVASRLVHDHKAANHKLEDLAKRAAVMLPPSAPKNTAPFDELKGQAFDVAFAQEMTNTHAVLLRQYRNLEQTATQQDLRDFAGEIVPILQVHLDSALGLNQGPGK